MFKPGMQSRQGVVGSRGLSTHLRGGTFSSSARGRRSLRRAKRMPYGRLRPDNAWSSRR